MIQFQRMTTEYLALDDRIRVSGETKSQEIIVLWLTQRLLLRLLPHLLEWLEKQTLSEIGPANTDNQAKEMLQEFAQQSARDELTGMAPVKPVRAEVTVNASVKESNGTKGVLVESVDIKKVNQTIQLVFKNPDKTQVGILMTAQQMRQWLAIIREHWQKASWPLSIWPKWISKSAPTDSIKAGQEFH